MSETSTSIAVANAADLWETVRGWCQNTIKDMSKDELLRRLGPERNNAWWLFGHITVTTDIGKYLSSSVHPAVPESWRDHFERKTQSSDTGEGYPDKETLMAQFHKNIDTAVKAINQMNDASFSDTPATQLPDPLHKYFLNKRDVIHGFATHASYHAGQIAIIRKMIGR